MRIPLGRILAVLALMASASPASETIWIEAEHLAGVKGYCWPMGPPKGRETDGRWGVSGPGWAAEWTQGGESGFMSIACGPEDDKAVASLDIEIPEAGTYHVWVRYRDNRECGSRFQIRLEQPGSQPWTATYGERPIVDEDNELKLYWDWAFAWDSREVKLQKGTARLSLLSAFKERDCRQIDCIVLTTDASYRPLIKERPKNATWDVLASYRRGFPKDMPPLARRTGDFSLPDAWKPKTFQNKGFLYLWNVDDQVKWAGSDPKRVLFPHNLRDADALKAFEAKYGGQQDVPIFSDPRIVPTFHGAGPKILSTDAKDAKLKASAECFVRWLDAHPGRFWAMMMNYAPDEPLSPAARENFQKYRGRYVGSIAGESLGYFYPKAEDMKAATAKARNRRELAEAFSQVDRATQAAKTRKVLGDDAGNPYTEVIPCQSCEGIAFWPLCFQWGARTVGYESSAMTASLLPMRMAFLRGAARQNGGLTATYRSCNFGDASTIFSDASTFSRAANIFDNFYSVFSGAGMTWYRFDIWYQFMCGSAMFYHEQGFDEFWMPGGTSAAGRHPVQLSPKGKLVDRFLRLTARGFDRGAVFAPIALLVDYAHGWEPSPFFPHAFGGHADRPDLTLYGDHERMLQEYFWIAYYPIGPRSQEPITALSEVYVPSVFGDIFDVIYAYPDVTRWTTLPTYRAAIVAGDIELTRAEGERLSKYVADGGTLLVADAHLTGPGVEALSLPKLGAQAEAAGYRWLDDATVHPSQRFRFRPIEGGKPLATTPDGKPFCAAFDRGQGRLIVLGVPRGLGIDRTAVPVLARLFAHLSRGLMPIEVEGDVEWMVNRTESGWMVTLLNPAGQNKPQHGITPTDFRENRPVTLRARVPITSAVDRLFPQDPLAVRDNAVSLIVPAGSVRIIELR